MGPEIAVLVLISSALASAPWWPRCNDVEHDRVEELSPEEREELAHPSSIPSEISITDIEFKDGSTSPMRTPSTPITSRSISSMTSVTFSSISNGSPFLPLLSPPSRSISPDHHSHHSLHARISPILEASSLLEESYLDSSPTDPSRHPEERYVATIDSFIRHRHDFYSPGYIYNIDRLRSEVPVPKALRQVINDRVSYIRFLKKRKNDFRVIANKSVELIHLTPFHIPGQRMLGYFHCVVKYCDFSWQSDCSYAERFELCPRCGAHVYPFAQEELRLQHPLGETSIDNSENLPEGIVYGRRSQPAASGFTSPIRARSPSPPIRQRRAPKAATPPMQAASSPPRRRSPNARQTVPKRPFKCPG